MVDILVLSLSCVLRSLSYNITQVFPRDEAAEKPTRDASPPLVVAFCGSVLCLSLFAWLRFTEKQ